MLVHIILFLTDDKNAYNGEDSALQIFSFHLPIAITTIISLLYQN